MKEMLAEDFFDFKTMSSFGETCQQMTTGRKLCEVRQGEDPSAMLISTAYDGIPKRLDLHPRGRRSADATAILETIPLAKVLRKHVIVLAKGKNPLSLCDTCQIPQSYRGYFGSMPVARRRLTCAGTSIPPPPSPSILYNFSYMRLLLLKAK